jgi:hypothetical protein
MYRTVLMIFSLLLVLSTVDLQAAKLVERGDGTVVDQSTGLIWQQQASGRMPWLEAVRFCNQLDLANVRGWRLPFRDELKTLVAPAGDSLLDEKVFTGEQAEVYWTLSREEQQPDQVWGVSFVDGKDYMFNRKDFNFQARCMIETAEAVYLPLLNKWANSWSAQDVDAYLDCYGQQFLPEGGLSREEWAKQRQVRLTKPKSIQVSVSDIKVISEEGSRAEIMFRQDYQANTYRDQVMKVLGLGLERGELVILSERTISQIK